MLARRRLSPCSFPLRKPQRVFGLFGSDRVRPRRFKSEFASGFLGGAFGGCFNYRAQRIAQQTGIFPIGVVNAPQLIAWTRSRGRAHGAQFSTTGAGEDVSATQNARTVPLVSDGWSRQRWDTTWLRKELAEETPRFSKSILRLEHSDFGALVSALWDGKLQFVQLCGEE